jgi:hypothetical protein
MGLRDLFRRRRPEAKQDSLIGAWVGQGVDMEFRRDGTLDYVVIEPGKRQIMKLTYRVEGDEIVSNQPSAPREERTKFCLNDGEMVLIYQGQRSTYRRRDG